MLGIAGAVGAGGELGIGLISVVGMLLGATNSEFFTTSAPCHNCRTPAMINPKTPIRATIMGVFSHHFFLDSEGRASAKILSRSGSTLERALACRSSIKFSKLLTYCGGADSTASPNSSFPSLELSLKPRKKALFAKYSNATLSERGLFSL